jgi:hydroxymethylpyrimidine pyrophosphatase-like HAD family hydrolase
MNHLYLNPDNTYNRLLKEYQQYGSIVIAFDFDNTIYDYHKQGLDCHEIIDILQKMKAINCFLIVWTASGDIEFVKNYCLENAIPFDAINENPPFFKSKSRKIYYNELLDDRAGLQESYSRLLKLYHHVISQSHQSK